MDVSIRTKNNQSTLTAGLAATLLLLIPTWALAEQQDQVLEYQPEAAMGMGWNSLTNRPSDARATCLDPDSYQSGTQNNNSGGGIREAHGSFQLVHSKSEIADGFGLNAAASYRSLAYEVSGSAKYAQSRQIDSEQVNVAGYVTVETRTQSLRGKSALASASVFMPSDAPAKTGVLESRLSGIRLSKEALKMLRKDPKEFFRKCGDGYVVDIYYGGRLNVFARLSSTSQSQKREVESSLQGGGGGAKASINGFVKSAKSNAVSAFNASYMVVGTDGRDISVSSVDGLKTTFDGFPGKVQANDTGIRLRVASYASLIPNAKRYRFGPAQDVIEAARLHNDLESVWRTLADMREGDLSSRLRWDLSVDKACLGNKQDEIRRFNQSLLGNIKTCGQQTRSSLTTPDICQRSVFPAKPNSGAADAQCPATTALINGQLSQFDYRLFYPVVKSSGLLPNCRKYSTAQIQSVVREQWIKPVIDTQCNADIALPQCDNGVRQQLLGNIHVVDTSTPLQPTGGYKRSCSKCKTKWASGGKAQMQCSCSKGGESKNTAWITLQCPQKTALQNCSRRLKYTASCG